MANYKQIIPFILSWEGGFCNRKNDRGGATIKGVTINTWRGYCAKKGKPATIETLKAMTTSEWEEIFKTMYWDALRLDNVTDQNVANIMVDWAWASGVGTAALGLVRDYDAMRVHDLVLECEHPAEAPDPSIARRRIGFYLRAGARATALESRVFGTRYAVLALPCGGTVPDAALCKELRTLYKVMVPHPYYRGQVIFYGS